MGVKKWLMKQQWRIVQIRGIWGLFYGILLLAVAYYEYIPFFVAMGTNGPFVFAGVILFIFLILGYIYDRVLVMWAPSQEVTIERNPYQYVPSPKDHIFWFPLYSALLDVTEVLAKEFDVDTSVIEETREYYAKLQQLRPEIRDNIDKGIELREEFVRTHQFKEES
jgi:hypothetical protein